MRRLLIFGFVIACSPRPVEPLTDSGVDAGEDAGAVDSGADAGADAGRDAGGRPDAGPTDGGYYWLFLDGGGCLPSTLATAAELASTPRAKTDLEGLAMESTGAFIADEVTYRRVEADYAQLRDLSTGQLLFGFIPEQEPTSLVVEVSDAGAYDGVEMLCLNFTYRARRLDPGSVAFFGAYDTPRLAPLYAAVPGVTRASPNVLGVPTLCGSVSDACLEIDGGTFTYLGMRERLLAGMCQTRWYLVTSTDAGAFSAMQLQESAAAQWRQDHLACARRLYSYALDDGGVK